MQQNPNNFLDWRYGKFPGVIREEHGFQARR
jgi:hypothetical protein